jgi:hypothetical protein
MRGRAADLGILALEDKIVQGAVAEVLNAIYEAGFLDCSMASALHTAPIRLCGCDRMAKQ